jgi:hypothetical protein
LKQGLKYEDNLGDKELNADQILEKLIEFLGEDFLNELHRLFASFDVEAGGSGSFDPSPKKYLH